MASKDRVAEVTGSTPWAGGWECYKVSVLGDEKEGGTCKFGERGWLRRVWVRPGCGPWNKELGIEENGKEAQKGETRCEYTWV